MEGHCDAEKLRRQRGLYFANLEDHKSTHQTHEAHRTFVGMLLHEARRYQREKNAQCPSSVRATSNSLLAVVLADIALVEEEAHETMKGSFHDGDSYAESLLLIVGRSIWRRTY